MQLIENLEWRYATKRFDSSKKISSDKLEKIKRAIQLSVSSYGLQLYKVLIIENSELREKLSPVSWDQPQITEASHLIVFCNYQKVSENHVDDYFERIAKIQNIDIKMLSDYRDFMKNKITEKSEMDRANWTAKQTYLALGNLLNACAELKIDACPMEGFDVEKYNEILELGPKGLSAAVIATIGYRSNDDDSQYRKKVRKPLSELFEIL